MAAQLVTLALERIERLEQGRPQATAVVITNPSETQGIITP
jgi:hypothetical protein